MLMLTCQNCGEMVTPNFARVFGDNQNTVDGCVNCLSSKELTGASDRETRRPH